MGRQKAWILLLVIFGVVFTASVSQASCSCKGIRLWGKVKVVTSFPDLKVQIVDTFPDIKVKKVSVTPSKCGEWQMVDAFPDFTIQIVDTFPDLKAQFVDAFPGM